MDNQSFELRRAGLLQMRGKPEYVDLYGEEVVGLLKEIEADPDEDRRKAHEERIKLDAKSQIAYLMSVAYNMIANGEDRDEAESQAM
jgi:hypothetical protein